MQVDKQEDGTYSITGLSFEDVKALSIVTGCMNGNPYDIFHVFDKLDDAVGEVEPHYAATYEHIVIDLDKLAKGE